MIGKFFLTQTMYKVGELQKGYKKAFEWLCEWIWFLLWWFWISVQHYTKMHTNIGVVLYFFHDAFSSITLRILNLYNKSQKILAFDIFGLKCCLHPYMPCYCCQSRNLLKNYLILIAWLCIYMLVENVYVKPFLRKLFLYPLYNIHVANKLLM